MKLSFEYKPNKQNEKDKTNNKKNICPRWKWFRVVIEPFPTFSRTIDFNTQHISQFPLVSFLFRLHLSFIKYWLVNDDRVYSFTHTFPRNQTTLSVYVKKGDKS